MLPLISHSIFSPSKPGGTTHLLECSWCSAAALDFSSWTLIKLWGFFSWLIDGALNFMKIAFHIFCCCCQILLLKVRVRMKGFFFFQEFNYPMHIMHKFLYCYFIDGMGVCVSSTYMYDISIQNLKLAFGWEMTLVLSFSSSMVYNLYCSLS